MPGSYKLGKRPPVLDDRTLRFSDYVTPALPTPPDSVAYYQNVPEWPMYYNNQYGDCTCAAAAHMIQNWTASASTELTPPNETVLTFYEHFVGKPPPQDAGCDMLSVLNYWRRVGLDKQKVQAFTSLDLNNQSQAESGVYLLGGIYIGLALPDFTIQGDDWLATPWVVPPGGPVGNAAPNPQNGHCVPAVGYDDEQLWIVTWGSLKSMSWGFYDAYADESYAAVSTDFIGKNDPPGFNLAALMNDLAQL